MDAIGKRAACTVNGMAHARRWTRHAPHRDACDICQPNDERDNAPGAASASIVGNAGHHRPSAIAARRAGASDAPPIKAAEQAILNTVHKLPAQLSDNQLAFMLLGQPGYPACAPFAGWPAAISWLSARLLAA